MTGRRGAPHRTDGYHERLWAPVAWWLVTTAIVASLAFAVGYPLGMAAGLAAFALLEAVAVWALVRAAARVEVDAGSLVAGRARLPLQVVSAVTELDPQRAALLRGRDADARAYLLLRPWVRAAVRVDLDDPDDRTPYWYVSTRRPAALAAATARGAGLAAPPPRDPHGGTDVTDRPDGAG